MPVDRVYSFPTSIWGIWKITEDEAILAREVPDEKIPDGLTNMLKRLEFLAGRALIKTLLKEWNVDFQRLEKDSFGKPFLPGASIHISLSHSYPHVAAVLNKEKNVGIDIEQPKDKLLRIAHRILAPDELQDAADNITKHCIYWCAKEALVKIYGKKDLIFSTHLRISPFPLSPSGHLVGRIIADNQETSIPLRYTVFDKFVVVISG